MASLSPSLPTNFPTSGFVVLNTGDRIEEETIPGYNPKSYYPVHLGQVFKSRYQVTTKLGYGVNSTVWLCRDLNEHCYFTLKVRTRARQQDDPEIAISHYLEKFPLDHPGKSMIRLVHDSFDIIGPNGMHKCLLYQPLLWNFATFLDLFSHRRFPKDLVQQSTQLLLVGLDYLHKCGVIHTDISPHNVLMQIKDQSILSDFAQIEIKQPSARMVRSDRTIHISRLMPPSPGLPMLCDFGEARVGSHKYSGDIMPGIMRAPEVILGMEWDCKVDIWAIGIMTWQLLTGNHLFSAQNEGILDDEQHLAEMVSLLGPPPKTFLDRGKRCSIYWDSEGSWKGSIPIPQQSFESREMLLDDASKALLIQFLRKTLRWIPEERPDAEELAYDEFLMQYYSGEPL